MKDCTDYDIVTYRFEIARQMEDTVRAPMTATEIRIREVEAKERFPGPSFEALLDGILGMQTAYAARQMEDTADAPVMATLGGPAPARTFPKGYGTQSDACNWQPPNDVQPGDWLNSLTSAERKDCPIYSGVIAYFPDALAAVARHSKQGNDKHNPGEPLHWSRGKSKDHEDCIARHLAGVGDRDSADGTRHSVGLAWRALALLQLEIEAAHARGEKV